MAGVLRFGVINLVNRSAKSLVKANTPIVFQVCNISGKTLRGDRKIIKPAPYPYKEKEYDLWRAFIDKTSKRFDENSKVMPNCNL
jgi:NADH dehydrogenase (ubiquinone) 1 alpha subcomplex subunit 10